MTTNCVNCGAPPRRRAANCEYCGTLAGGGEAVMSDEYGEVIVQSARMAASCLGALSGKVPEPAEPVSYGPLSWTAITAGAAAIMHNLLI